MYILTIQFSYLNIQLGEYIKRTTKRRNANRTIISNLHIGTYLHLSLLQEHMYIVVQSLPGHNCSTNYCANYHKRVPTLTTTPETITENPIAHHPCKHVRAREHVHFKFRASHQLEPVAGDHYLMMQHPLASTQRVTVTPTQQYGVQCDWRFYDAHLPDELTLCPAHRLAPVAWTVLVHVTTLSRGGT